MATTRLADIEPLALPVQHVVAPARAGRKLAAALGVLLLVLPLLLAFVPWQQNVPAAGRVTAVLPLDRIQTIPAPVSGRLVELNVREGSVVQKGDVLAEMEDLDPGFTLRLEQQFQFASDKVTAARGTLEFHEEQLRHLQEGREHALASARFELGIAIEKVRAAERELEALEAELEQKRADRERKWNLFTQDIASELDFQKAEADFQSGRAKVEAAKAKVEQARNEESSKMARVEKVGADEAAKIESTKSAREKARQDVALAEKERTEARTALARQETQVIVAPRTGTILRVHGATTSDLISRGQPLIDLVPRTDALGVELWVRGIDAPLVNPGRKVRLQFEGWPAVQFAGWPSVAVGTFGGEVLLVDGQAAADGRSRVLVVPDPTEAPWPEQRYLRQGVRASGWIQLDTVSLGYEIWRQLNAFPPSVRNAPDAEGDAAGKGGGKEAKEMTLEGEGKKP